LSSIFLIYYLNNGVALFISTTGEPNLKDTDKFWRC